MFDKFVHIASKEQHCNLNSNTPISKPMPTSFWPWVRWAREENRQLWIQIQFPVKTWVSFKKLFERLWVSFNHMHIIWFSFNHMHIIYLKVQLRCKKICNVTGIRGQDTTLCLLLTPRHFPQCFFYRWLWNTDIHIWRKWEGRQRISAEYN